MQTAGAELRGEPGLGASHLVQCTGHTVRLHDVHANIPDQHSAVWHLCGHSGAALQLALPAPHCAAHTCGGSDRYENTCLFVSVVLMQCQSMFL